MIAATSFRILPSVNRIINCLQSLKNDFPVIENINKELDLPIKNNEDSSNKFNYIDNSIEETFFETQEFGGANVSEFEKKVIVTSKSNGSVPWWMSKKWLLLSTTILMAWPYRWVFQCNTGKTKYESKKRIFINDPNTSADPNNHIFDLQRFHYRHYPRNQLLLVLNLLIPSIPLLQVIDFDDLCLQ